MKTKKKRKQKTLHNHHNTSLSFQFVPDVQLDFHDYHTLIPYDIEKILYEFIEDSYVAGHTNLLIITGKGQVVRPHVAKLLKTNLFVRNFNPAGYFNGQEGAFEVVLKQKI